MSLKKTLLLAFILIVAVFYIKEVEIPNEEATDKQELVVGDVKALQIESIEVTRPSGSYTLKNLESKIPAASEQTKPAHWEIDGINGSKLEPSTISTVLSNIVSLKTGKSISPEDLNSDLSVYGLKVPAVKLKIAAKKPNGTEQVELAFGKRNEYLSQRYIQVSKPGVTGIYLISDALFALVDKEAVDFRKRNLIEFADTDVKSLKLQNQGEVTQVARVENPETSPLKRSQWDMTAPLNVEVGDASVSELFRNLRNLKVKEFIDGDKAKAETYGLDHPGLQIALEFKAEAPTQALEVSVAKKEIKEVGKPADKKKEEATSAITKEVYMSVQGLPGIFLLEQDPFETVYQSPKNLRETQYLRFSPDAVREFTIQKTGTADIHAVKSGEEWKVNEQNGDKTFIRQYLSDLSQLKATDFPASNAKDFGFATPGLRVSLKIAGSDPNAAASEVTFLVGKEVVSRDKTAQSFYAGINDGNKPFVVSKESVEKASSKLEKLIPVPAPAPQASEALAAAESSAQ